MEEKKKTGRPPMQLDVRQIRELASILCTNEEIAAVMGCSPDTLERRYSEIIKTAKESGKCSLRRAQWKAAIGGNATMLIWLGKHILGQRETDLPAQHQTEAATLFRKWEESARALACGSRDDAREDEE